MESDQKLKLTVVMPAYNEQDVIEISILAVEKVLREIGDKFELIIVNDGSIDQTLTKVLAYAKSNEWLRVISLPRNVGHMSAITAGLEASKGDFVVTIDADLQDPPQHIIEMYEVAKNNQDVQVVQAIRKDRSSDTVLKRMTAKLYYRLASLMAGFEVIQDGADFRLMKREVVDFLVNLKEKSRIYRLLIPYFGFETRYINVKREARFAGETKYPFSRMLSLTLDSFFNFSNMPLKFFTKIGLFSSIIFFAASILSLLIWALGDSSLIPGWTSIIFILLFSNGLLLTALGIVGEYVGRIYTQVLERPNVEWRELN